MDSHPCLVVTISDSAELEIYYTKYALGTQNLSIPCSQMSKENLHFTRNPQGTCTHIRIY